MLQLHLELNPHVSEKAGLPLENAKPNVAVPVVGSQRLLHCACVVCGLPNLAENKIAGHKSGTADLIEGIQV